MREMFWNCASSGLSFQFYLTNIQHVLCNKSMVPTIYLTKNGRRMFHNFFIHRTSIISYHMASADSIAICCFCTKCFFFARTALYFSVKNLPDFRSTKYYSKKCVIMQPRIFPCRESNMHFCMLRSRCNYYNKPETNGMSVSGRFQIKPYEV